LDLVNLAGSFRPLSPPLPGRPAHIVANPGNPPCVVTVVKTLLEFSFASAPLRTSFTPVPPPPTSSPNEFGAGIGPKLVFPPSPFSHPFPQMLIFLRPETRRWRIPLLSPFFSPSSGAPHRAGLFKAEDLTLFLLVSASLRRPRTNTDEICVSPLCGCGPPVEGCPSVVAHAALTPLAVSQLAAFPPGFVFLLCIFHGGYAFFFFFLPPM